MRHSTPQTNSMAQPSNTRWTLGIAIAFLPTRGPVQRGIKTSSSRLSSGLHSIIAKTNTDQQYIFFHDLLTSIAL